MSSDHKLDLLKKTPQDIIQDIKLNTFKSKLTKELTSKNMIFLSGFFWVKNKTLASYHHHHHHQYFLFFKFFFKTITPSQPVRLYQGENHDETRTSVKEVSVLASNGQEWDEKTEPEVKQKCYWF